MPQATPTHVSRSPGGVFLRADKNHMGIRMSNSRPLWQRARTRKSSTSRCLLVSTIGADPSEGPQLGWTPFCLSLFWALAFLSLSKGATPRFTLGLRARPMSWETLAGTNVCVPVCTQASITACEDRKLLARWPHGRACPVCVPRVARMSWSVPGGLVGCPLWCRGHLSTEPANSQARVLWGLAEGRRGEEQVEPERR